VAHASARLRDLRSIGPGARLSLLIVLGGIACGEGGNLAISAGAPVSGLVIGRITRCGDPVAGAEVLLLVQQDRPEQARPVDARIGPVNTSSEGRYQVEVSPAFAVPGEASMQLRVTENGLTQEIGGTLALNLGVPPRDTTRFDADLGAERGQC
jgi:hypothetical protein